METKLTAAATADGIRLGDGVIEYSSVIQQLDSGHYDKSVSEGMRAIACVWEAQESGWFHPSPEQEVIIWRWLVAAVFLGEEQDKNGIAEIQNDEGGIDRAVIYVGKDGSIGLYPGPTRFALACHVEGIALEKYGAGIGLEMAVRIYRSMVIADPKQGFSMSKTGRKGLEILHDEFIEQINTDGMPEMPVTH
ncbi:hypothetical protein PO461_11965 [Enterobacter asburiae]|uniref:hypothetical protein n=1 Tax=Enterobacter asburiae TaxID=61645 RepID=UPI002FFBCE54